MLSWKDISIKKYLKIQEVLETDYDDSDKMILIANIVYDQDITELYLPEYNKKIKELNFIHTLPDNEKLSDNYTVNGTKYKAATRIDVVQANQFIDFQNYAKKEDLVGCISCFFIPDGHKYNDGYDMLKVKEDIADLPITTANALAFFFKAQYVILLVLSNRSSLQSMKEMGMSKEKMTEIVDSLSKLGIAHLVSTLM